MTCKKCGASLNRNAYFCDNCGTPVKKKCWPGLLVGLFVVILLLGGGLFIYNMERPDDSSSFLDEDIDTIATQTAAWLNAGDISFITSENDPGDEATNESEIRSEFESLFGDDAKTETVNADSLFTMILQHSEITAEVVGEKQIQYTIVAPDMNTFVQQLDYLEEYDDETTQNILTTYLESGTRAENTIIVSLDSLDGSSAVSFQSVEFLDAISGGMLTAYGEMYNRMISEIEAIVEGGQYE